MLRKVITVPAECKGHIKTILEGSNTEIIGTESEYFNESKYHSNVKYDEVAFIGEFSVEEDDILVEDIISDKIYYGKNAYNYQIHVYSNEGPVPHFHILGSNKDVCICIFEPRYFDHGSHVGTLNAKELKVLNKFLDLQNPKTDESYWNTIVYMWKYLNRSNKTSYSNYPTSNTQPDYTHMQGFKSGKTY